MPTTPVSVIPYPSNTDSPAVSSDIQDVAEALDTICIPKYASTSARDTAITSPVDGQHAYITGTRKLYVYRNSYSTWHEYSPTILKVKTINETLSSSATYQDDNELQQIPYKANTWYLLRGVISLHSETAADFRLRLIWTSTPADGAFAFVRTGNPCESLTGSLTGSFDVLPTHGGSVRDFHALYATLLTHATNSGTVKLQWAQATSNASTTTVYRGSYIELLEAK